jgi:hypothetical protein
MLDEREKKGLRSGYRINMAIWLLMLASLGVYVLVCHLAGDVLRQDMGPDFPLDTLKSILLVISLAEFVIIRYLRNAMLRAGAPQAVEISTSGYPDAAFIALKKYTSATLVAMAIAETIGIYGLILFMLGDDFQTLYLFILISAIAMLYFRPRWSGLEALALETKKSMEQA